MDGAALIQDQLASAALSAAAPPGIDPASASAPASAAATPPDTDTDKKGPLPTPIRLADPIRPAGHPV